MGADILPVASLVGDVLDGDNIPSIDYEKFMGICEDCGKDISIDDDYSYNDEGDLLCPDCANLYYAIDEDEDEDEEEIPEENVPV
jgi:Zn finger protein HypA/HybF involved in hydrogenase expression